MLEVKDIDARFNELKRLARNKEPLPSEAADSAADIKAYEGMCGIYQMWQHRDEGNQALIIQGRSIRAAYIREKRDELLQEMVYKNHQLLYRETAELTDRLTKGEIEDPTACLDALCELIGALRGETVTSKIIRQHAGRVLLHEGEKPKQKKQIPKKTAEPTLEEFTALWKSYCSKKGFAFVEADAERCFLWYDENGWRQKNGNKIKNWKATVYKSVLDNQKKSQKQTKDNTYTSDASYDLEAFAKSAIGLQDDYKEVSA